MAHVRRILNRKALQHNLLGVGKFALTEINLTQRKQRIERFRIGFDRR